MDKIRCLFDTPMQVGECPLWHAEEATLYWIDIADKAIHSHHPATAFHRSWQLPSEPGCIALCSTGGLIVAMRSGLALFDPLTSALSSIADAPYDTASIRFNDGRCDASGRLWIGTLYEPRDKTRGSLFKLERGVLHDMGRPVTVSNGIAFSMDNRTFYHSDTRAHTITRYDFDRATGNISHGRLFKQFSENRLENYGGRPDGAAVDSENAYWCAMFEGGRLLRISPSGEMLREIALPVRCPTMIAFGGHDLCTLYITSARLNRPAAELAQYPLSGCLFSVQVDVPGLLENFYIP